MSTRRECIQRSLAGLAGANLWAGSSGEAISGARETSRPYRSNIKLAELVNLGEDSKAIPEVPGCPGPHVGPGNGL